MREICIPLPDFLEQQIANVEVTVNGEKRKFNFRVESFRWQIELENQLDENEQIEKRIARLRQQIDTYDKQWQLVQIFKPGRDSNYIQVLFRQKLTE